ncbi:MAG: hypothetical protein WCG27_03145 [Pseudomonadota bacterium]
MCYSDLEAVTGICAVNIAPVAPFAAYSCPANPAGMGNCPASGTFTCTHVGTTLSGTVNQYTLAGCTGTITTSYPSITSVLGCSGTVPTNWTSPVCVFPNRCIGPADGCATCFLCSIPAIYMKGDPNWTTFNCNYTY